MNYNPEDLPFRLDKTHRAALTDQLVDGDPETLTPLSPELLRQA